MSVLVEEKVDDRKSGANNNDDSIGEIQHELMEWHPTSGLLALTTYRANVGSEISFFTHQVSKYLLNKEVGSLLNNRYYKCKVIVRITINSLFHQHLKIKKSQ